MIVVTQPNASGLAGTLGILRFIPVHPCGWERKPIPRVTIRDR